MLRLKLRHSAPRRGEPTAEERALRAAYWTDAVSVLRRRLDLTAALFLLFVGVATFAEMLSYPERVRIVALVYGAEVAACLLAMAACRAPRLRLGQRAIGAGLMALLASLMSGYNAWVGNPAEPFAMAQVSLLMCLVVLLPWGWICQLVVASVAFATFAVTVPYLSQTGLVIHSLLALAAAATTSVWGALFLDRYRYEAFRRSALHREEAEIAEVLLHVGEALTRHLDQPDVLECVNRLTVEALGCDWSSTYLWDPERRVFRLRANAGATPEVRASVAQIDFAPDRLPGLQGFRPGEIIELADVAGQPSLLASLLERWNISSMLAVPISRGEEIVGSLVVGYRRSTGPFSAKQRRLGLGIAHATALALENARLITDLQAANRVKTEFVSTMSHELRTPLNVMLGYAEMAQDANLGERERLAYVHRIQGAGRDLLDLIESTLEVGRMEAGHDGVRLELAARLIDGEFLVLDRLQIRMHLQRLAARVLHQPDEGPADALVARVHDPFFTADRSLFQTGLLVLMILDRLDLLGLRDDGPAKDNLALDGAPAVGIIRGPSRSSQEESQAGQQTQNDRERTRRHGYFPPSPVGCAGR